MVFFEMSSSRSNFANLLEVLLNKSVNLGPKEPRNSAITDLRYCWPFDRLEEEIRQVSRKAARININHPFAATKSSRAAIFPDEPCKNSNMHGQLARRSPQKSGTTCRLLKAAVGDSRRQTHLNLGSIRENNIMFQGRIRITRHHIPQVYQTVLNMIE
jgi:hypothetical protein